MGILLLKLKNSKREFGMVNTKLHILKATLDSLIMKDIDKLVRLVRKT